MNLLINQDRPANQKYNKLYHVTDDQWTKLTACDMRTALVNEKLENQRSCTSPASPMPHYTSSSSPAPVRSTILWELASIKKSIKGGAWQAFSTLRDEHHFEYFQRDLFIIAKSHDVSEILDPTFTPGPSQEEKEFFEANQTFMNKVYKETLLTDMGRSKVRTHHRTTDAQAVWKQYSEYMTTASWQVKVVNRIPRSTICNPEPKSSCVLDTPNHQSHPVHPHIYPSPDDPPRSVDKSHLSDSTSTTTNLNETCPLDTSCDHLLHLVSPSLSSELQDNSSVDSVEIEFLPESEGQSDHVNLSSTDVFSLKHDYDLFLLNQEIDAPNYNLNHQDTHICENQDDILIHATILSHTFALLQFMAQHNCEDLKPTDTPITVPTTLQALDHQPP